MANKSKATKVRQLTNYRGNVYLYSLSKALKKGKNSFKNVIVSYGGGLSGKNTVTMWYADEKGTIASNEPVGKFGNLSVEQAFDKLGYNVG